MDSCFPKLIRESLIGSEAWHKPSFRKQFYLENPLLLWDVVHGNQRPSISSSGCEDKHLTHFHWKLTFTIRLDWKSFCVWTLNAVMASISMLGVCDFDDHERYGMFWRKKLITVFVHWYWFGPGTWWDMLIQDRTCYNKLW